MNGLIRNYDESPKCATQGISAYVAPTSRQILEEKKAHRQKELDEVEAAIKFLDENPTFENGLNLLSKALR